MGITSARPASWEVSPDCIMYCKVLTIVWLTVLVGAAPSPDADPQYLLNGHIAAPHALVAAPASNCEVAEVILVTQTCTPTAENVCTKETVETEEIEYEKVCKEVVDTICDVPATYHGLHKREAEADPTYFAAHAPLSAPLAIAHHVATPVVHPAPLPVAHHVHLPVATAVAHSATTTIKHACREVTTEHCVDNPKVKNVPVEVEHCHTITKVTCADVENKLPKTTCEAVITSATSHAAVAAPAAYHAGYGYGK